MATTETATRLDALARNIRDLVERVSPSVVMIRNGNGDGGAGVRWSHDLVISNHHVVHHDTCRILFYDGVESTAQVIARDSGNDLVALRIEGAPPELDYPLPIDLSRSPRIGEFVLAIGHPMGADWAVTSGIISRLPDDRARRRLLRASVTLLPGNSGGALINTNGELIGINTMLSGPAEALAVPVDIAVAFAQMAAVIEPS